MMQIDKPRIFQYKINKNEYNIPVRKFYPILIDYGQSERTNKVDGSPDIFTFLSDFSVDTDGTRPKVNNSGKPILSIHLPKKIGETVLSMIKDIMYYYVDIDTHAPYSEWLKPRFMLTDALLKKYFLRKYSKRLVGEITTFNL